MNLYRFRFLSQKCLQILSSPFWSQVGFRSQENNGSSRTVMAHFWDPLGLHVPETGGAGDGETDQEHILNTNINLSARSARYRAKSLQFPDMKQV